MEYCEICDNLSPLVAISDRSNIFQLFFLEGYLVAISAESFLILMIGFREDVKSFKRGT